MKIKNRKFIICFSQFVVFFFIISGCNNWVENPVSTETKTGKDSVEIITKLPYPEKTNKIISLSDASVIVGSSDGKFYKSVDDGKTWQKTGEITSSSAINCFFEYEESVSKKKYFYAGTEEGIYVSEDAGGSWKASLITSKNGEKIKVYCFETIVNSTAKKDSIVAYGWDGTNNKFKLLFGENNWSAEILSPPIPYKITSKIVFYELIFPNLPSGGTNTNYLYCCNNGTEVFTYRIKLSSINTSLPIKSSYKHSNINQVYSVQYYSGKLFYTTNKGILVVNSSAESVLQTALAGLNVRSLVILNNIFAAATDKGIFYSIDFGANWKQFNISIEPDNINEIFIRNNKIYIIKNNGEVMAGSFYEYSSRSIFNPLLLSPADNSEVNVSNIKFSWKRLEENSSALFALQISTGTDFKQTETLLIDNISDQSFTVPELKSNTQYYWRILSYNFYKKNNEMPPFTFRTK